MKLKLSNRTHRRMAAACLTSLAIGLAAGFGAAGEPNAEPAVEAGRVGTACILPDTRLRLEVVYNSCGHTQYHTLDKPDWIGKTREELAALSPADSIALFNAKEVCLVRVVDAYCSEHLQLRTGADGNVGVYRTNAGTHQDELILALPTRAEDLSEGARSDLSDGLLFGSMEEINAYLESMES